MEENIGFIKKHPKLITHFTAFIIASLYLSLLLITSKDIGFARDEGFYFSAGERYMQWFDMLIDNPTQSMEQRNIDRFWRENHEHPSLMKTLFGLSWKIFNKKLGIMNESTAFRFPGMLFSAILLYFIVLFGTWIGSRWVGISAALFMAFLPRFFYHAHLSCFDVAITTMWFIIMYAFLKSLKSFSWAVAAGILWGLGLETKLNSFFIPPLLIAYYFIVEIRNFKFPRFITSRRKWLQLITLPSLISFPSIPLSFFFMAIFGPILFIGLWPWLWNDTINRISGYLSFHMHHAYYNIEYFGVNYFNPPFPVSFPFVMTAITFPLITLIFACSGIIIRLYNAVKKIIHQFKHKSDSSNEQHEIKGVDFFLLINLFFPIILIALPSTPIFGGTKHWMPAWPFICLYAGFSFCYWINYLKEKLSNIAVIKNILQNKAASFILILASLLFVIAPAVIQTRSSHPFALTHYTALIGESPGAASAGMNRQFWGFTTGSTIAWLNKNAKHNAQVFIHDTNWSSFNMYRRDKRLRSDIRTNGRIQSSDIALVHLEQHFLITEHEIWSYTGSPTPSYLVSHQGVAVLPIYRKVR